MSDWNKIKERISIPFEGGIKELPALLTEEQKAEVTEDYRIYFSGEMDKEPDKRKFYIDKYGGTVYMTQFPKKSFLETISSKMQWADHGKSYRWWGIKVPLLENFFGNGRVPFTTVFLIKEFNKATFIDTANKVESLWEGEDKDTFHILRGNITIKYTWQDDQKGIFGRFENVFIKEAREKFDDKSIKSIDDIIGNPIYKASLGQLDITLNPNQRLKVL